MAIIEVKGLTHHYGVVDALVDVDLEVPEGSVYALLGPNGAGKTTLLQILMRLRRPDAGRVSVLGKDVTRLGLEERASIGYVAEDQRLPGWMTLQELEAYLAPLYATWDHALADELRRRFRLDARRRLRTLSRGEHMKAALLCTMAARPRLLLLDEPFTGMDAVVKDDLVRGLLVSAGDEGMTVLISSHDLSELEALADWVGFLDQGKLLLSEPMEVLRERFQRVEVISGDGANPLADVLPADWLSVERAGPRVTFLTSLPPDPPGVDPVRGWFPDAARIETRPASLREIFVALAGRSASEPATEEVRV